MRALQRAFFAAVARRNVCSTRVDGSGVETHSHGDTKRSTADGYAPMRTHHCGELRLHDEGSSVRLCGWLAHSRLSGRFLVLRDAFGKIQLRVPDHLQETANSATPESVLSVEGLVADRGRDHRNPEMPTGDVEIDVQDLRLLSRAVTPLPLQVGRPNVEETRQRQRCLALRADDQKALRFRATAVHRMRRFLTERASCVEVETPTLFKPTPGGALEFAVPVQRPEKGLVYSLPQSPQQFKQMLMCAGLDRYFQVARCYRDESARGDRQPEFTQVDLELSFTTQPAVMRLVEDLVRASWPDELKDHPPPTTSFDKISYADAMRWYGSDKPDLRIPWKIETLAGGGASYFVARNAGGKIGGAAQLKEWKRILEMNRNATKFALVTRRKPKAPPHVDVKELLDQAQANDEDVVVLAWHPTSAPAIQWTLGQLRNLAGAALGLRSKEEFRFLWVVDFPLFVQSEEDGSIESAHHPFTAPIDEDLSKLKEAIGKTEKEADLLSITAQHYDLVLNGAEAGGGSVRIHDADLQERVLRDVLHETDLSEMSHLLEALSQGAPPHAGFALGLDRYVALLFARGDTDRATVRSVIAFPKSTDGRCPVTHAPTEPSRRQIESYGLPEYKPTRETQRKEDDRG